MYDFMYDHKQYDRIEIEITYFDTASVDDPYGGEGTIILPSDIATPVATINFCVFCVKNPPFLIFLYKMKIHMPGSISMNWYVLELAGATLTYLCSIQKSESHSNTIIDQS
ncbi:hypothetical protein [Chengkuizengella axinellae]|uniref:Uncharacterized protein n=1 Tax=Chengkuizengella axinellae TaxID=3064388 RepID=A0ABT9IV79_9BACL|nr:hypothetical protein [Chengkuizengella sp. 2205SS18-9]MDP5273243.1 hypothetical protein [Chengkuizengella sp. 2205SS18-9]